MGSNITDLPPILISLKPEFADLIFDGIKTAELRKRISSEFEDRDVFVYVSSPICELRGGFRVGEVWSGSPLEVWNMVHELAGISAEEYHRYYDAANVAYALEVLDVWKFANPISLGRLREKFPGFSAPQSYRFVRDLEKRSFSRMRKINNSTKSKSEFADQLVG